MIILTFNGYVGAQLLLKISYVYHRFGDNIRVFNIIMASLPISWSLATYKSEGLPAVITIFWSNPLSKFWQINYNPDLSKHVLVMILSRSQVAFVFSTRLFA